MLSIIKKLNQNFILMPLAQFQTPKSSFVTATVCMDNANSESKPSETEETITTVNSCENFEQIEPVLPPIAPIDVDPWTDEEESKACTVDLEAVESLRKEVDYPEPPADRTGVYEFEGLKIWLPKNMLKAETYRYRMSDEDKDQLPDDIRICKFHKTQPAKVDEGNATNSDEK